MLREKISDGLKEAMKARNQRRVSTLRMINAGLKDRDIEARGLGKDPLSDDDLLGLLQKMIKQRQESLDIYEKAGRHDLAAQEREEIAIIASFMPQQLDAAETQAAIAEIVRETGAAGMKDMGRVMAALKERYSGRMDFAKASGAVKGMLTS